MVPVVEFNQTDVRQALRTLFRQGLFGGTIAPDVQGTITVSLRNVPWTTALQNVTRQVDATYRIRNGFFEVVRREEFQSPFPAEPDERETALRDAYQAIQRNIAAGRGVEVLAYFGEYFVAKSATQTQKGARAVRSFIDSFRSYPRFDIERFEWGRNMLEAGVVVGYRRPGTAPIYFRDSWQRLPNDRWWLAAREETALNPPLRFVDIPASVVIAKAFRDVGVSWTFDSRLDRNRSITVDLTGLPFEDALTKVTRLLGATYRIEGGVYLIVPRE